ncbi:MAG TPA: hypothetical protein ENI33_06105 [Thermoplasmatales archaeon]|nr:hypothetical protein [Thermoplasmatales archaeon]
MIFLQDAGCDTAYRYRGTQGNNGLYGLGLFEANGRYKKTAYAFKAMKILLESPKRLYMNEMDYNESFAFIAGVSEDRKNVTLLISNYESEYNEYSLTIENLPWDSDFTYIRYVLDDFNDLGIVEVKNLNGSSFSTCEKMPANTVHLIRLTTVEKIPPMINILKPRRGCLYIFDREITPTLLENTIIIGQITIETDVYSIKGVDRVEFYVDNGLEYTDYEKPYSWTWNEFSVGKHEIKVIAYDTQKNKAIDKTNVIIFNIG